MRHQVPARKSKSTPEAPVSCLTTPWSAMLGPVLTPCTSKALVTFNFESSGSRLNPAFAIANHQLKIRKPYIFSKDSVFLFQVDMARNTISELDLPASSWCGFFACAMLAVTLGEVVKVNNAQQTPYMVGSSFLLIYIKHFL